MIVSRFAANCIKVQTILWLKNTFLKYVDEWDEELKKPNTEKKKAS